MSSSHVAYPEAAKARRLTLKAGMEVTIIPGLASRSTATYWRSWSAVLAEDRSATLSKRWWGPPPELMFSSMRVKGSLSAMIDVLIGSKLMRQERYLRVC